MQKAKPLFRKPSHRLTLMIVLLSALSTPWITAEAPTGRSSVSVNLAGLVTADVAQYPLGVEVKYGQDFEFLTLELLGSISYARERGFDALVAYLEPRVRWDYPLGSPAWHTRGFVATGLFGGVSAFSELTEPLVGFDVNVGFRQHFSERGFYEVGAGVQYPDFPTNRSFRLHYWFPAINYLSLRTAVSLGILL